MAIDWSAFTPGPAIAGGLLFGLGAAILVLGHGRVAGISGILGSLLRPQRGEIAWRVAFLAGLLAAPLAYALFATLPAATIEASPALLVAAGLLVGVGTRYASGCTSGHGVCGLSRLSPRSLVATLTFMAAGFLTVYVLRHALA
jgi:uncharacterized membrane protein YedE/YeeE